MMRLAFSVLHLEVYFLGGMEEEDFQPVSEWDEGTEGLLNNKMYE